ncbi:MAG TPA: hypothetical protein VMJ11_09225 [Paraburkholderia sp.]|nr:hypothetical protein [Paraburkholderia sp.]
MSLLQGNDQDYPGYGDIVKFVKEVKEMPPQANAQVGTRGEAKCSHSYWPSPLSQFDFCRRQASAVCNDD